MNTERGVALVIVLWIAVILSGIVLAGAAITRTEIRRAYYPVQELQALGLAIDGVERVKDELCRDTTGYTCLNQGWRTAAYAPGSEEKGSLYVSVEDEESKMNLNTADNASLRRLLEALNMGNSDEIASAIADWRDSDSAARPFGAEEDYYLSLEVPRSCKNAPLDSLDELRIVKGGEGNDRIGILEKAGTLYSSGKINVNTASAEVLASLPGLGYAEAQTIIAARNGPDLTAGTGDDIPFTIESDVRALVGEDVYRQIAGSITVQSSFFKVRSTGTVHKVTKAVETVLERSGKKIKLRYWREL